MLYAKTKEVGGQQKIGSCWILAEEAVRRNMMLWEAVMGGGSACCVYVP
jgi:hypothetical protein